MTSKETFWVIGDPKSRVFAHWGGPHHDCYVDTSYVDIAERFSSYKGARAWMKEGDLAYWRSQHCNPRDIKPVKVVITTQI